MAFRRKALLAIGGFDPQFRQAGDDVDVCWRLLAEKRRLGYAAGAMVWHHRRCTVRAYYQQQKGYGRAEAMLAFKHPQRFLATGLLRFDGVIYGDGLAGLPLLPPKVYHGRFGSALFQTIYQSREFRFDARATSLEWHSLSGMFLVLSTMVPLLALISAVMWLLSLRSIAATAGRASLPPDFPYRRRLLVYWLHLTQPVVRGMHRNGYTLRNKRLPQILPPKQEQRAGLRTISPIAREIYWPTRNGRGRAELLDAIETIARQEGWPGDFYGGWAPWDIELMADLWHHVSISTATEELAWPKRFTRARWTARPTRVARATTAVVGAWSAAALVMNIPWALVLGLIGASTILATVMRSRRRCLSAVGDLISRAARNSGLAGDDAGAAQEVRTDHATSSVKRSREKSGVPIVHDGDWYTGMNTGFAPTSDATPL
jgi:hypothetical protein